MEDESYERQLTYLGKENEATTYSGNFKWNQKGNAISLHEAGEMVQQYTVGENVLIQLDREGKGITGDLADNYRLRKFVSDTDLEDHKWLLSLLHDEGVSPAGKQPLPSLTFHSELGQLTGNNGCNAIADSIPSMKAKPDHFRPFVHKTGLSGYGALPKFQSNDGAGSTVSHCG